MQGTQHCLCGDPGPALPRPDLRKETRVREESQDMGGGGPGAQAKGGGVGTSPPDWAPAMLSGERELERGPLRGG